jgi:hypothetical protein
MMRRSMNFLRILLFTPICAFAANTDVSTGTSLFNCNTDCGGACSAGDTLTLLGTARNSIRFENCTQGTASQPIIIRNDVTESGPIVISRGGSGFALWIDDADNLTIDGTGLWSGVAAGKGCGTEFSDLTGDESNQACGIVVQCTGSSVTTLLKVRHDVTNLTVKGVELDGNFPTCVRPGIGMGLNDNSQTQDDNPGEYYEGFIIEDNYIHDMATECIYSGGNILTPRLQESRDNIYRRNLLRRCGWDALSLKTHDSTMSFVTDNIVIESGVNPDGTGIDGNSGACYNAFEAAQITWNGNYAADCAGNGPGTCYESLITKSTTTDIALGQQVVFFNNVGVDCKGHGIGVSVNPSGASITSLEAIMYNNTIVSAGSNGLYIDNDTAVAGTVQDNIACDSGGSDVSMGSGAAHTATSNSTGTCSSMLFDNLVGRDFHLSNVSSPAYDAGGVYASPPTVDFDNISRPRGTNEEDGAYELIEGGGPGPGDNITTPKPNPHSIDAGETHYPHHLYVITEEAGATVEDDGSSTDADLTITGADWSTDALGPYLQFIRANSDYAENTAITAFTGTVTMCAIVRINGAQGTPSERFMWLGDNAVADRQYALQSTGGLGYLQGFAWDTTASNTSEGPPSITDNLWHMVCARASDTILDISVNGAAWDTESQSLTSLFTNMDTIALGGERSTTPSYADVDILAAWIYRATKTDAEIAVIYNSGDPWPIIGVDPSSGPPPVAQRGQFENTGVTK